jgi:hypothetical protein
LEGDAVMLDEGVGFPETVVVEEREAVAEIVCVAVPLEVIVCVGKAVEAAVGENVAVTVGVRERDTVVEAVTVGDEVE